MVGPLLAALFAPRPDLPEDEELAVSTPPETAALDLTPAARTGPTAIPPSIKVLYVANGRLRAQSPHLMIRGLVDDDRGGDIHVTVNGLPAEVKDRSFARRIAVPAGESRAVVRAEDTDGNVAYQHFILMRTLPHVRATSSIPPAVANVDTPDYRFLEAPVEPRAPRLEDISEPGVYMVLMAGTPAAHIIPMRSLEACRAAAEFTENAACTYHNGRR